MDSGSEPSREEEDLRDRSTKKVKMGDLQDLVIIFDQNVHQLDSSPKEKPSYRDTVTAYEVFDENCEEMVRVITEDLYPDVAMLDDDDSFIPQSFNPNPEVKISHDEYENWCQEVQSNVANSSSEMKVEGAPVSSPAEDASLHVSNMALSTSQNLAQDSCFGP
ncbi:dihydrofolate reductase [Sesbania bispinosa]|nr:dihydrofolate reductase [Sesbania bispinosa]